MDHVTKVTFPAFARMQDDKDSLAKGVTRSIFFISFLVMPTLVGIIVLAPLAFNVIPGYKKWDLALTPLMFVSVNVFFAAITTQLTNVLNSIGKIKITFMLMIMWTLLTYALVPFLALRLGVNGAAFAYALVGISSIVAIIVARRFVNFSLSDSALKPFVASLAMGAILFTLKQLLPVNLYSIWVLVLVGGISYAVIMFILVGISLLSDVKATFRTIFNK